MHFAFAFIFAATISSPSLGRFFELPDWMPREVQSDRTPGSIDATNMTHRIDATALAAVNACFEAYYERAFVMNEGNSNVWDVAEWGPRYHDPAFPFDTNGVRTAFVYAPDTNRVIETRRLVEYDNLSSLVTNVLWNDDRTLDDAFLLKRPFWGGSTSGDYPDGGVGYMSTTIFDALEGHESVDFPVTPPNIGWYTGSQFCRQLAATDWARVGMTWDILNRNLGPVAKWRLSNRPTHGFIPTEMLAEVNLQEFPFTNFPSDDEYWLTQGLMPSDDVTGINPNNYPTNSTDSVIGTGAYVPGEVVTHTETRTEYFDYYADGTVESLLHNLCLRYVGDIGALPEPFDGTADLVITPLLIDDKIGVDVSIVFEPGTGTTYSGDVTVARYPSHFMPEEYTLADAYFTYGDPRREVREGVRFHCYPYAYAYFLEPGAGTADMTTVYEYETTNMVKVTVGVEGLTNDTRRLVTDRLAGIAHALSALDRNYYKVTPTFNHVATNMEFTNSMEFETDSVPAYIAWEDGVGGHIAATCELPPLRAVSRPQMYTNRAESAAVDEHYAVRVGRIESDVSPEVAVAADSRIWNYSFELSEEYLGRCIREVLPSDYEGWVDIYPNAAITELRDGKFFVEMDFDVYGPGVIYSFTVSDSTNLPTSVQLVGSAYYSRRYDYLKTMPPWVGMTDGNPIHPGSAYASTKTGGSAEACALWSIASAGALVGTTTNNAVTTGMDVRHHDLWDIEDPRVRDCNYRSFNYNYSDVATCVDYIADIFNMMVVKVDSLVNRHSGTPDFTNPFVTIPISAGDVADMVLVADADETLIGPAGFINGASTPETVYCSPYMLSGYFRHGEITIDYALYPKDPEDWRTEMYDDTPHWPLRVVGVNLAANGAKFKEGHDRPDVVDTYGVSAGGYTTFMSKVDWLGWGALKREPETTERNNQ